MANFNTTYYREIIKMFFPVFISRVGIYTMSVVDALMLAHYSAIQLGYQSIGDTPITFLLLAINGLVQGTLFITAQSYGQKDYAGCGQALYQGIKHGLGLGLISIPIFILAPYILASFNYTPENIKTSSSIMQILAISMPFSILYIVCQFFLQGIKRPWISSWFVLIANVLNLALNWIFINGKFGIPALGGVGAALSTATVRIFLGLGLTFYIFYHSEFKVFLKNKIREKFPFNKLQSLLGWGATANMLSVESAYAFCVFFISSMSVLTLAAYTLSYRLLMITGLISVSMAVSASVLVGIGFGQKNIKIIKQSVFNAINLNNAAMITLTLLAYYFAPKLAHLITNDTNLATQIIPMLKLMSLILFFSGIQTILTINLRAIHDLIIPSLIIFIFFPIMVPLSCYFFASSAVNVIAAILAANIFTSLGLSLRFLYLLSHYKFK